MALQFVPYNVVFVTFLNVLIRRVPIESPENDQFLEIEMNKIRVHH